MNQDEFLAAVDTDLTPEVLAALDLLHTAGFAVVAWTPTELRGADPRRVQDVMTEHGWDVIDVLATDPDWTEDDDNEKGGN